MSEDSSSMTNASSIAPQLELDWGTWLSEHGSKLLLFARQQTRSIADAEDILQDALVKLAQKVEEESFDGGQQAWLPFLYTSIRRNAIDLGRKNDRRTKREEKVEHDRTLQNNNIIDPWFDSDSADQELRDHIEAGLKHIPAKFSEVIIMKIWGERTFAEIGEALNIPQNTAASRYRYGLEALRDNLNIARAIDDLA